MQHVPDRDERKWLLQGLAGIIGARGFEQFVLSPIVEPTPKFFPDPVASLAAGLDRVTRRLMQYAGLGALDVRIDSFRGGELEEGEDATHCWRVAGCFLGIDNGYCRFGINLDLPPDIEHLAGVMAHEVAHAYRAHHGIESDDKGDEELLTDVTTAYLGFGILALNNSYRFRKSGLAYMSSSESATGYLSPQAHSFLLACQIVARALEPGRRKAIYRQLETNQAAFVRAAVKLFEEEGLAVTDALPLPAAERWPPARTLEEILEPLKPLGPTTDPEPQGEAPEPWNQGRPVFRIARSNLLGLCFFYSLVGAVGITVSQLFLGTWLAGLPLVLAGLIVGVRRGRRTRRDECSDSDCATTLDPAWTRCPTCAGEIMGRLDHPEDRLEMEERLAAAARRRARAARSKMERESSK